MGKKKKNIIVSANDKYAHTTKMVTSNSCLTCKNQCQRGKVYLEKMSNPGAVGKGVPCVLTKGRAFK